MGIDFSYYRKMNGMDDVPEDNGNSENTEIIDRMSRILKDSNSKIIHSFDLYKRQGMLTESKKLRYNIETIENFHIFFKKVKEPTLNSLMRGIYADHNVLKTGDYITYVDQYSEVEETYIVRSKPEPKRTYEEATLLFCNETMKWVNKKTKLVKQYPMVISHDKHSIDVNESGVLETEKSWTLAFAQANPDTLTLITGDRFIFRAEDGVTWSSYEVIDINPHALNGLLMLKMKKVKVNVIDDDLINGIANYHSIIKSEVPQVQISQIIGDIELLLGQTNTYSAIGIDLSDYTWEIEHVKGDYEPSKYLMTTTDDTNLLYINAVSSAKSIGSKFDVVLKNPSGIEYARKRIEVTGW